MAGISIGIDLCHYPLLVGCQISGTFLVQEGSKGAKLKSNNGIKATTAELVELFEDARDVAKSYFGSPNINNAVLVVPNDYNYKACEQSIKEAADRASIHIVDIIPEHIAVAAAYADKTKPKDEDFAKITIISSTSGALCDVHVVSISRVASGMGYRYQQVNKKRGSQAHVDASAGAEKISSIGKISFAGPRLEGRESIVVMAGNNLPRIKQAVDQLLEGESSEEKVAGSEKVVVGLEKVVFVGKSAELVNMREIIKEGFTLIEEWTDTTELDHHSDQLAVYGAAKLAYYGNRVEWNQA